MNTKHSPWGPVQHSKTLAEGIVQVSTAGHGGILLSPERYAKMPSFFKDTWAGGAAYEEDCDWAKVAVVFPEAFSATSVAAAFRSLRGSRDVKQTVLDYLDRCPAKQIADAESERTKQMWRVGSFGSAPSGKRGWIVIVTHNTTGAMRRGLMADLPRASDLDEAALAALWTEPPVDLQ